MQDQSKVNFRMHFKALDGFRALAVTAVFCAHYGGGMHQGVVMQWLDRLSAMGVAGVGMFFVLSGWYLSLAFSCGARLATYLVSFCPYRGLTGGFFLPLRYSSCFGHEL